MIFSFRQDKLSKIDWSTIQADRSKKNSDRYLIAKEAFLSRYNSSRLAKKLLNGLEASNQLILALRHGDGRAYVIERFFGYASQNEKRRHPLDRSYDTVEKIILPLINQGRIASFHALEIYWSHVTDDNPDRVFESFDWLSRHLVDADEWLLRELCFRSDLLSGRNDDFFALEEICDPATFCDRFFRNYKQIKENILNKDFDEARAEQHERKQRYAPRTGEGGLYKEVKVRLHPDLIATLKDVVGGGNRTAWIEEAILQRLEREGVEFSLPQQPPLPHK